MRQLNKIFGGLLLLLMVLAWQSCSRQNYLSGTMPNGKAQRVVAAFHDPTTKYVIVVAHRADWRNYPENSLPAIESAIRMGVDVVELDVRMTKDSVLVICHDATIDRTTTGKGAIKDFTYEELQAFDLKCGNEVFKPSVKMPTLKQALEICRGRIVVNVDKGYDFYDQVLALTEEMGVTDQVLIKGSKPRAEVDAKLAQYPRNMMFMPVLSVSGNANLKTFNSYADAPSPPIAFELCFDTLDEKARSAFQKARQVGSKIWVNTLWDSLCGGYTDDRAFESDNPDEVYGFLLDLGTSIIQTDRPEFLIKYLEKKGRRKLPKVH